MIDDLRQQIACHELDLLLQLVNIVSYKDQYMSGSSVGEQAVKPDVLLCYKDTAFIRAL